MVRILQKLSLLGLLSCASLACSGGDANDSSSGGSGGGAGTGASSGEGGGGEAGPDHWVGTWGTSPQLTEEQNNPPAPGLSGNTLRQFAAASLGGSELRLQVSNEFGDGPVSIESVHVALAADRAPAIHEETDVTLSFSGSETVTIPEGEAVYSDSFAMDLPEQTIVAVTIHFGEVPTGITGHPGSRTTSYLAEGDQSSSSEFSESVTTDHWYYMTRLEVMAPARAGAVVTLGDSLTDGRGSTTNGNDRWPDVLARRLREFPSTAQVGVINAGIGGNAVLSGGLGPTGLERFERDVLSQAGVRWVIVLHGVNDIGYSSGQSVAERLIEAYGDFVTQAHAAGLSIYGVPLLPFGASSYDSTSHAAARETVNDWIRFSGQYDAVIDAETALADPAHPERLLSTYQDGDFLHLNPLGYQILAENIDLGLFVP